MFFVGSGFVRGVLGREYFLFKGWLKWGWGGFVGWKKSLCRRGMGRRVGVLCSSFLDFLNYIFYC